MCLLPLQRKLFIPYHNFHHLSHLIMLKKLLLMAATVAIVAPAFAQDTKEEKLKEKGELNKLNEGWNRKVGLGLGMNQIGVVNPRVGGANDQLGFNGILTAGITYRMGRMAWDNVGALQYGVLRNGSFFKPFNEIPYVKSMDNLVLNSKFGYGISEKPVWFYSVAAGFRSQITPTYQGNLLSNSVPDITIGNEVIKEQPIADFLAPATFYIAPGMDYKPNDNFSVLISPATFRMIIVNNDAIAKLGTMGNPVTRNAAGAITNWQKTDVQFGASLTANYKNEFLDKRIQFQTGLNLFSNYLRDPQNIDIDWGTTTKVNIFKGFGIGLNTNLYYDNDVDVIVRDEKGTGVSIGGKVIAPAGYKLSKNVQFIEGFFITYDRTF
jgi:Protein of unknown function (DUF3078)